MFARLAVFLFGITLASMACATTADVHIVPKPQHLSVGEGHFTIDADTVVTAPEGERTVEIARFLRDAIARQTGVDVAAGTRADDHRIDLRLDDSIDGKEAYRLTVTPDHVEIAAATTHGLFWGVQTLRQLLPVDPHGAVQVPVLRITDAPSYPWRGIMLDVARHFQPVSFIKKQIDLMSYYKFNVFHWHLTDDQAWRIHIKQYPKLTGVGAWRDEGGDKPYGGFYTPADIREVIDYAHKHNMRVVPEIEMPGHSTAAIAAYPELSCTDKDLEVATGWGVFANALCVGEDNTYTFVHNVLDEVMALFPSSYVHIGGDEVPDGVWKHCPACRQLAESHGLEGKAGLQSYFIERVRRYLADHGKTMIGWDEILEGDLDPDAVVEVWRGPDEGKKALANGNRVIIAGPFYLDAAISGRTLEDIYRNNPFQLPMYARHPDQVLGGEAPLWSEYITPRNATAKLYPRALAVSEHLWNTQADDVDDFLRRVRAQYPLWASNGVPYGPENKDIVDYSLSWHPGYHRWRISAVRGFDDMRLHYTTDGSEPTVDSPYFKDVLDLYEPKTVTVVPFRDGVPYAVSRSFHIVPNLAQGKPVDYTHAPSRTYAGSLVDGMLGDGDYRSGRWAGWQGAPMDAVIDLGQPTEIRRIQARFLQETAAWIVLPRSVRFQVSDDGQSWTTLRTVSLDADPTAGDIMIKPVDGKLSEPVTARYVRVLAKPSKQSVHGGTPFIFADEIIVQ
ncbi:MAG TPA: family 20 glycosylhydrolase [Oleiagrimonas sp.]|nr:family 20 glycosylhydrolase [Oleiagrimonas sp.]